MGVVNSLPFSDNLMKWNEGKRRYILKEKAFESETGINLEQKINGALGEVSNMLNFYLDNISLKIYSYIYSHTTDKGYMLHVLSHSPVARGMLYEAMIQQTIYFVTNGDPSQFSGINIKNGQIMDRSRLIRGSLAPAAEAIILNAEIPELGYVSPVNIGIC